MSDYTSTDKLYQLCEQRLHVLQQIRALTLQQYDQVHTLETDQLLSLLAQKQHLLDEIQSIQAQLIPYQQEDPDSRRWSSKERRAQCREWMEQGQGILKDLVALEAASIEALSQQRDGVASELQLYRSSQEVRSAYDSHEMFHGAAQLDSLHSSHLSLEG